MSAISETVVQVNRPDDCSAPQASKNVVAGLEKPPKNEPAAVLSKVDDGVDAADSRASPPSDRDKSASPIEQKHYADSTTTPPLRGDKPTEDVPRSADSEIEDDTYSIKDEVVDLGNDTYFYDDKTFQFKVNTPKKVGFDRGLEPDHIVGATEQNGKLMFLIAWKNSVDGEADLLEAKEIYEKCPQLAIKFFEDRLIYIPPDTSNKK
ncbi:chromobox protein homolog 3-like [Rhopalosiphum maidis]|uniref:chromobox protein homolog 3-like n=1 Tax=Rhopalosiphum maidis TaxID=43146 RepID=UPI000EFE59C6|nr:chromobox protein homolog 3-like [Rhopalosiphum maidis]